ncbi:MAG: SulP family inorganic anion transporter [Acidimicrobiia bacterium]|nr:SulP family inorganic anion transporter [Acidimicrobiia bacterium]
MTGRSTALARWLPILGWLPTYDRSWLRPDLVAGLTVWALLVPEAMAYADLAGMPPETGLYAALGAIVAYAIFGTSRQLFVGPSSTVAILSLSTVGAVATTDNVVDLTIALALLVGVLSIMAGLFRLGFISVFMSKPVLTGFMFGLGLTVAVGQLPKLFGVEGGSGNFFQQLWAVVEELPDADLRTSAIGVGSLVILLVGRRIFGHGVPMALIVVFVSILLSNLLDWSDLGVHVVGEIPASLPSLTVPDVELGDIRDLLPGALAIVLIGFAESYGAAQNYARKHGDDIDASQELIALGASNVGAGLLGGFTVDGSLSRTAAADDAGAKSQMAMLICGAITFVTILAFTPLFEALPEAVLGAVVISAIWGTFNVTEMRRVWRANRLDFAAAAIALLGVIMIDLLEGLLIAVLMSFVLVIYRASRPSMPKLEQIPGGPYVDADRWRTEPTPGVVIVRFDAPLIFAGAEALEKRIDELLDEVSTDEAAGPLRAVVLDLESVSDIDTDGADTLRSIHDGLQERDVSFLIARLNRPGRQALARAGVFDRIGEAHFFLSVRTAVNSITGEQLDAAERMIQRYQLED